MAIPSPTSRGAGRPVTQNKNQNQKKRKRSGKFD
jgi:hypothetical protein